MIVPDLSIGVLGVLCNVVQTIEHRASQKGKYLRHETTGIHRSLNSGFGDDGFYCFRQRHWITRSVDADEKTPRSKTVGNINDQS